MKNYIISCLSPVARSPRQNTYVDPSLEKSVIEGFMTNEAPAKSVINYIAEHRLGRLDGVIVVCSDKVMNQKLEEMITDPPAGSEFLKHTHDPEALQRTHVGFYENRIQKYAETVDPCYKRDLIDFQEVSVSDLPDGREIGTAAMKALENIQTDQNDNKEYPNLFIDFTGGPRSLSFMLLSLANLIRIRDIRIRRVLYMNFDNKDENNRVLIQEMNNVFTSFDLISGLNEFISYGRIAGLKQYFKDSKSPEIHSLLNQMEQFSDELLLCQTERIMHDKKQLFAALNTYIDDVSKQKTGKDSYEDLFAYIAQDILSGYQNFLTEELPEMLQWCLEKGFIMQALTFVTELTPQYFKKYIFKPTDSEWEEYSWLLKKAGSNKSRKGETWKAFGKAASRKADEAAIAYAWFNTFTDDYEMDKISDQKRVCPDLDIDFPEENQKRLRTLQRKYEKEYPDFGKIYPRSYKPGEIFPFIRKAVEKSEMAWDYWRIVPLDTESQRRKFEDACAFYYVLKQQRNNINHAGDAWEMSKIQKYLQEFIEILKDLRK